MCYKSNFWELDWLTDAKSTTVIKTLKAILVTDNSPQLVFSNFSRFTKTWGIDYTTTSPNNSKANAKVEWAIKVAKHTLHKTTKSGKLNTSPY